MTDFKIDVCSIEEAKKSIRNYEYALIYYISDVVLERIKKITDINWNEVQEAYFFDKNGQLHFFDNGSGMKSVIFLPEKARYIEKEYELANIYKSIGNKVVIREYFDCDDDGQSFIAYTALCDVE